MEVLKRAVILAAGLLAAGCEFLRSPTPLELTDEQIMVHAVLQTGTDTVSVLLTRVRPQPNATPGSPFVDVLPLSGADVRITGGGSTVRLAEAPAGFAPCVQLSQFAESGKPRSFGPGCYVAVLPGGVGSGVQYALSAGLPGGGEITGVAEVPAAPVILRPTENARFTVRRQHGGGSGVGEVPVRWTAPANAGGIELRLAATAVFANGSQVPGARCGIEQPVGPVYDVERGDSTTMVIYNPIHCFLRTESGSTSLLDQDSIHVRLRVTAYDTVYTRYASALESGGSVQRSRFAAGVTGALGVFAGAATADRQITLVTVR